MPPKETQFGTPFCLAHSGSAYRGQKEYYSSPGGGAGNPSIPQANAHTHTHSGSAPRGQKEYHVSPEGGADNPSIPHATAHTHTHSAQGMS